MAATLGLTSPGITTAPLSTIAQAYRTFDKVLCAKVTLVALLTIGLVVAAVFSGGAAAAVALAGASIFHITLFSGISAATGFSALASLGFAFENNMFTHTTTNASDALWYTLDTLGASIYCVVLAVDCAIRVGIIELLGRVLSR